MKIRGAFIVPTEPILLEDGDEIRESWLCIPTVSASGVWSRPRLKFARLAVRRYVVCRRLWRWLP